MIVDGRADIGAWPNLDLAPNVGISGVADTGATRVIMAGQSQSNPVASKKIMLVTEITLKPTKTH
jgi:hypothetical protein